MDKSILECKNCSQPVQDKYCSSCGQKFGLKRFKLTNLHEEFLHGFFHIHHGFFFTARELFIRPGVSIRNYIDGKRVDYFNPFTYMVLISILGGIVFAYSGSIEHARENYMASIETIAFTRDHPSYRMLTVIPVYAILCFLIFRSSKYNLAEHFIISTFLVSQGIILFCVWFIYADFVDLNDIAFRVLRACGILSLIVYQTISMVRVFNTEKFALRFAKAAFAVIAGVGLNSLLLNLIFSFLN
jgi:hypothetical protein